MLARHCLQQKQIDGFHLRWYKYLEETSGIVHPNIKMSIFTHDISNWMPFYYCGTKQEIFYRISTRLFSKQWKWDSIILLLITCSCCIYYYFKLDYICYMFRLSWTFLMGFCHFSSFLFSCFIFDFSLISLQHTRISFSCQGNICTFVFIIYRCMPSVVSCMN